MKVPGSKLRLPIREGGPIATRTIRARVLAGRIEPLEAIRLREGQEVRVVVELAKKRPQATQPKVTFASWDLGTFQPLRRADIYDDVA